MSALAAELRVILGDAQVLVDDDLRAGYETDWTGRFQGHATAVVRPGTTEEVAAVVDAVARHGAALVPQGGNTGLVGGGVPGDPSEQWVVVSTRRLTLQGEVDPDAAQVTLGAGVTITQWRELARSAGLDAPVDFASRDSATIGGAIATNAGGSRVVRFGTMRSQVVGIEAVLGNGSVIGSLSGLPKETVGIHLPSLIAGSEGTLGIITAARLRLVPWYRETVTAMIATADVSDAVRVLGRLRGRLSSLDSIELVLPEALELVANYLDSRPPVPSDGPVIVLECADHEDPTAALTEALAEAPEIRDAAIASGGGPREHLLGFRDRITEAINAVGIPLKLDVAVPIGKLGALLDQAREVVQRRGGRLIPFGHLAEGNVHLNVLDATDPDAITDDVLGVVASMGGTISAEHGVGRAKIRWVGLVRSPTEIETWRSIRAALDPAGVMNPGVLIPEDAGRAG